MEIIKRAALSPAEPSAQDVRVAAQADQLKAQARQDQLRNDGEQGDEEGTGSAGTAGRTRRQPQSPAAAADGDPSGTDAGAPRASPSSSTGRAVASYQASAGLLIGRAPALFAITV